MDKSKAVTNQHPFRAGVGMGIVCVQKVQFHS